MTKEDAAPPGGRGQGKKRKNRAKSAHYVPPGRQVAAAAIAPDATSDVGAMSKKAKHAAYVPSPAPVATKPVVTSRGAINLRSNAPVTPSVPVSADQYDGTSSSGKSKSKKKKRKKAGTSGDASDISPGENSSVTESPMKVARRLNAAAIGSSTSTPLTASAKSLPRVSTNKPTPPSGDPLAPVHPKGGTKAVAQLSNDVSPNVPDKQGGHTSAKVRPTPPSGAQGTAPANLSLPSLPSKSSLAKKRKKANRAAAAAAAKQLNQGPDVATDSPTTGTPEVSSSPSNPVEPSHVTTKSSLAAGRAFAKALKAVATVPSDTEQLPSMVVTTSTLVVVADSINASPVRAPPQPVERPVRSSNIATSGRHVSTPPNAPNPVVSKQARTGNAITSDTPAGTTKTSVPCTVVSSISSSATSAKFTPETPTVDSESTSEPAPLAKGHDSSGPDDKVVTKPTEPSVDNETLPSPGRKTTPAKSPSNSTASTTPRVDAKPSDVVTLPSAVAPDILKPAATPEATTTQVPSTNASQVASTSAPVPPATSPTKHPVPQPTSAPLSPLMDPEATQFPSNATTPKQSTPVPDIAPSVDTTTPRSALSEPLVRSSSPSVSREQTTVAASPSEPCPTKAPSPVVTPAGWSVPPAAPTIASPTPPTVVNTGSTITRAPRTQDPPSPVSPAFRSHRNVDLIPTTIPTPRPQPQSTPATPLAASIPRRLHAPSVATTTTPASSAPSSIVGVAPRPASTRQAPPPLFPQPPSMLPSHVPSPVAPSTPSWTVTSFGTTPSPSASLSSNLSTRVACSPLSTWFLSSGQANFIRQSNAALSTKPKEYNSAISTPAISAEEKAFYAHLASTHWRSWYTATSVAPDSVLDPPLPHVPTDVQVKIDSVNPTKLPPSIQQECDLPSSFDKMMAALSREKAASSSFERQMIQVLQGKTMSGQPFEEAYRSILD